MTTVKVKWRPSGIGNKSGTIVYQIIHNRESRLLKTDYKISLDEWNDVSRMILTADIRNERSFVFSSIQNRIKRDVERINCIIGKYGKRNIQYTSDDIICTFRNQSYGLYFFNYMESVIFNLKSLNKYRTAENYTATLNSFSYFRNNEDLFLGEINSDLMMQYEAYLSSRGITKNTISFYMRILRAVYNRAVEENLTEQRNPFKNVYTGIDKTIKRAIPLSAIKRIKELDLSYLPVLDFARDVFMFSFYTRGMSFIDVACLRKTDLKNGSLVYCRRKTGRQLTIKWERCMQEIVSKYERTEVYGYSSKDSLYLLPILRGPFDEKRNQYRTVLQQVNKSLKTIALLAKVDVPLTMYVARHSWASIAKSKNIPISVISEGMGHDSELTTQIYLASFETAVIDHANNLILEDL